MADVQLDTLGADIETALTTRTAAQRSTFDTAMAASFTEVQKAASRLAVNAQAALSRSSPFIWKAQASSVTVFAMDCAVPSTTGTATAAGIATTDLITYTPRVEYLVTTPSTSAVAGFRGPNGLVTVGGPSAGLGGFRFVGRWAPATGVTIATHRAFFGLGASGAPTDVEPSTMVTSVFMGWDAADTNIQMMHNDAAGACTKVDLGASFPVPSVDRGNLYELQLYSPPGTTQTVDYLVTDLVSLATASGTISTNLPTTTSLLNPRGWMSVGGTSSVIGISFNTCYLDPLL